MPTGDGGLIVAPALEGFGPPYARVTSVLAEVLTVLQVGTMAVPSPSMSGTNIIPGTGSMAVAPTFAGSGYTAADVTGTGSMARANPVMAGTGTMANDVTGSGATYVLAVLPGNNVSATYAVVQDGRVVSIGYGPIPEPTETILYIDLTGLSTPSVGDYWLEVCQTFQDTPPVVPPGDIVPPWTKPRDGTDGNPGDDGAPGGDGEVPLAFTMPVLIPFHTDGGTGLTVTNIPAALTEVSTRMRTAYDLTDVCAIRLQCQVMTAATGHLVLQYSTDNGSTWDPVSDPIDYDAEGPFVSIASTGYQEGTFLNPVDDAKTEVLLSIFARNGDGSSDPVVGNLSALCYTKTSSGACSIVEPTIEVCDVLPTVTAGPFGELFRDDFDYATDEEFRAAWLAIDDYGTAAGPLSGVSLYRCNSATNSEFAGGVARSNGSGFLFTVIGLDSGTNEIWYRGHEWFLTGAPASVMESTTYSFPQFGGNGVGFQVYRDATEWRWSLGGTYHTQASHTASAYVAVQSHDVIIHYWADATTAYTEVWDNGVLVLDAEAPWTHNAAPGTRWATLCWLGTSDRIITFVESYLAANPYGL